MKPFNQTFVIFIVLFVCVIGVYYYLTTLSLPNLCLNAGEKRTVSFNENDFNQQLYYNKNYSIARRQLIGETNDVVHLQFAYVPQINCLTPLRVGNVNDGGKWVCSPWRAPQPCVVYSLGSGDITFEIGMYQIVKCGIYSFDEVSQDLKKYKQFNGVFRPWKISTFTKENASEWTILDIMKHFNHDRIDFFKIDIEEYEFSVLPPLLHSNIVKTGGVCQLMVEIHGPPTYENHAARWKGLFSQLEHAGFLMFYKEVNYSQQGLHEFSYIHKSCLMQYGVSYYAYYNF